MKIKIQFFGLLFSTVTTAQTDGQKAVCNSASTESPHNNNERVVIQSELFTLLTACNKRSEIINNGLSNYM